MISRFFIDRPIFATVLSVVFVLAGGVAVFTLPVAQYPEVTPPTVQVTAVLPRRQRPDGARHRGGADRGAGQRRRGHDVHVLACTNDGAYTLTVTFKLGMDSDMAQVLVQNRVSLALPVIPPLVQNEGINVKKMSPNTLMIVNLISPDGQYDSTFLSNYATIYVKDELGRLPGVAGITYLGQRDYSLRAWLDPDKLAALNLSAHGRGHRHQPAEPPGRRRADRPAAGARGPAVSAHHQHPGPARRTGAVRRHHPQGRWSGQPADAPPAAAAERSSQPGQQRHVAGGPTDQDGSTAGRLVAAGAGIVRLRDVARVELGSQQYDQSCTLDGKPSVALSIYQLPGSNALDTADGVYAKMKELKTRFPDGLDYKIVYDTTPFIRESVNEVFNTLRDAVILVAIVVLVFLQDWRAMILPMIDVPVSLIGTFAVMAAHGLHAEQPDAVRPGAGHRHRGRRRHRRAGKHRAADRHRPGRPDRHDQGHGGDHRARPGHHAGA